MIRGFGAKEEWTTQRQCCEPGRLMKARAVTDQKERARCEALQSPCDAATRSLGVRLGTTTIHASQEQRRIARQQIGVPGERRVELCIVIASQAEIRAVH